MKDLPVFTTDHGVASLGLKQIPYNATAYITLHDSLQTEKLIKECCDFCIAAGAESVYASGHDCFKDYPLHTAILLKQCLRKRLADTDADLIPVQAATLEDFRNLYNDAMKAVHNASFVSTVDAKKILEEGNGYFVYRETKLIGIGVAAGKRIEAIVSVMPGCGEDVLFALNRVLIGPYAEVEVASTNTRALRLYDRLGFETVSVLSEWYKIF